MQKPEFDRELFDRAVRIVEPWDFSLTIQKMQEPKYAGWSLPRILAAERDYKRYLSLIAGLGGYKPVPNSDIDRFWHEHILDTKRYAEDCQSLFGHMLHHYPFFGMRGETDNSNWMDAAKFSNNMWKELFGEDLYQFGKTAPTEVSVLEGEEGMTTISITINISGGKAEVADVTVDRKTDEPSSKIIELDGKKYVLTPAPSDLVPMDVEKCPQKCPNEG